MEKIIGLLGCLIIYSCQAQKINQFDSWNKDIIVFYLDNKNITPIDSIYIENNYIIFLKWWASEDMGHGHIVKEFEFIREKDTMNIKYYVQGINYFFKNLKFKKGNYKLKFNHLENNIVYGYQIKTSEEMQNILFKNTFVDADWETKNAYFKDIKFREIDLKDTANVKLEEIK